MTRFLFAAGLSLSIATAGKPRPFHSGTFTTADGVTTSRHVTLGVCQTKAGGVYVLMLLPYTVLEIAPESRK